MIDISCAMQTTASAIQRPRSAAGLFVTAMEIILAKVMIHCQMILNPLIGFRRGGSSDRSRHADDAVAAVQGGLHAGQRGADRHQPAPLPGAPLPLGPRGGSAT